MKERNSGFTLIEVLVVITIIATLAGLVVMLIPTAQDRSAQFECQNRVRNIIGLFEQGARYPTQSGANLILYLVKKGDYQGKDALEQLFCPGDLHEGLKEAGGEAAYENLDLSLVHEHGHLTSYAGRDQSKPEWRAKKGGGKAVVLICDDSADHHAKGIVVGLTGGIARFRSKLDDYELDAKEQLVIGMGSQAPELVCMRTD